MTLAAIFLFSIFCNISVSSLHSTPGYPSAEAMPSVTSTDPQTQSGATQTQPQQPADAKPSSPSTSGAKDSATQPPIKLVHHKKKNSAGCNAATKPQSTTATPNPNPGSTPTTGPSSGQVTGNGKPSGDCPPSKIVVRQGGTTEPPIQLAGKQPGGQASQEKATANQMLESTDENLKKLEGRQLSSTEQDMVTQIRQFMEQSKAAVTAGDSDRARNLAWKAQTLSEELIKPAQ
jgi:hypothetical protein